MGPQNSLRGEVQSQGVMVQRPKAPRCYSSIRQKGGVDGVPISLRQSRPGHIVFDRLTCTMLGSATLTASLIAIGAVETFDSEVTIVVGVLLTSVLLRTEATGAP